MAPAGIRTKKVSRRQWLLLQELDTALAALIDDLEARKRLDKTLIVIGTEFGRPWDFDGAGGRGHQSTTFSLVLIGGGLKHKGAIGVTDEQSKTIIERPVSIPDFHATIHHALGIDCHAELYDGDRPVPITDRGTPVRELFFVATAAKRWVGCLQDLREIFTAPTVWRRWLRRTAWKAVLRLRLTRHLLA